MILPIALLMSTTNIFAKENIQVIPKPRVMEVTSSEFTVTHKTKIIYNEGLKEQGALLQDLLTNATLYELPISKGYKASKNSVFISLDDSITDNEGYVLDVTENGVSISGKTSSGIFYGIQTLLQLMPVQVYSKTPCRDIEWTIPTIHIEDEPLFAWRGMMLDVSRYFMTKEYVLQYIDMMAMYKLNSLHLHLVDDSGWRLESKKYPKLTSIGSFRGEGENRSGGYYTHEDIKEMVAYGALRGVTIIPELEFPAHVLLGVVAYPWLSCRGEQLKVPDYHYISKDILCVGKATTIQFLEDIIAETCEIFPSKYIHVGGDEAVYEYWDDCPHCKKVKEDNGLKKSAELQSYLTNIVADMAAKHKRTIVGWEEILQRGKINEPTVSMIWKGMGGTQEALDLGHKVVLTPATHLYFDFPESNLPGEIKAAGWMPPISVEKCYNFNLSKYEQNKNVLGVHGCLWTDQFIHGKSLQEIDLLNENRSENYVTYLTMPRLLALSELGWIPHKDKNFEEFEDRLATHYKRMDYAGFNYRVPTPEIVSTTKVDGGYMIELKSPIEYATMHYTVDGSKPTPYDPIYTDKVKVAQLADFRAITTITKTNHSVPTFFFDDYKKYKSFGQFAKKISYKELKEGDNIIEINLTGKISDDANYEITLIPLTDKLSVTIGDIDIFKRNDKSGSASYDTTLSSSPITKSVSISEWQAGTPYSAKIEAKVSAENRGNFAVFVKKID